MGEDVCTFAGRLHDNYCIRRNGNNTPICIVPSRCSQAKEKLDLNFRVKKCQRGTQVSPDDISFVDPMISDGRSLQDVHLLAKLVDLDLGFAFKATYRTVENATWPESQVFLENQLTDDPALKKADSLSQQKQMALQAAVDGGMPMVIDSA